MQDMNVGWVPRCLCTPAGRGRARQDAARQPRPGGPTAPGMALALAAILGLAAASPAVPERLPAPAGEVILSVSGQIGNRNAEGAALFDRSMLEDLGTVSVTTTTIWTEGSSTYVGVPLHAVLEAVAAEGSTLTALALNDYSVSFPVDEIAPEVPILAFLRDGAPMSVRDKGPLWILYPYDDSETYRTELILGRSVWQLDRLRIHD